MTQSSPKFAFLKYEGPIAMMAGRTKESISLEGIKNINDLLTKLDEKYPGFKQIFIPPNGIFNSRTGIVVKRPGMLGFPVIDPNAEIKDNDTILLW